MTALPKVRFILGNRKSAVFAEDPDSIPALKKYFQFQPTNFDKTDKFLEGVWDGWISFYRRGYVPTGILLDRLPQLRAKFDVEVLNRRRGPKFKSIPAVESDRPYQVDCLVAMIRASSTGGIVLSCTASGKSRIACMYGSILNAPLCFAVDELTLAEQTRSAFQQLLDEPIGTVGGGVFNPQRITVATIQSLFLHRKRADFKAWYKTLEVLILDELHTMLNDRTEAVVSAVEPKAVFGLTATLALDSLETRLSAMALTGPVIYTYPLQRGQEEGYIAPGVAARVRVVQRIGRISGQEAYAKLVVNSSLRNACICALVQEGLKRGRVIAVIVERLQHIENLSRLFHGTPHTVLHGAYKVELRRKAQAEMEQGKLKLLLTNRIFSKGIDITRLDTVIDATAGKDANATIQRFGRGTRLNNEKLGLIHIDICDAAPFNAPGRNPFAEHSLMRRDALLQVGVPMQTAVWRDNAKQIWDAVELMLGETKDTAA